MERRRVIKYPDLDEDMPALIKCHSHSPCLKNGRRLSWRMFHSCVDEPKKKKDAFRLLCSMKYGIKKDDIREHVNVSCCFWLLLEGKSAHNCWSGICYLRNISICGKRSSAHDLCLCTIENLKDFYLQSVFAAFGNVANQKHICWFLECNSQSEVF